MESCSHRVLLAALVLCCTAIPARAQTLFFDSFDAPGDRALRAAGDSLGSLLTPSHDVLITHIAVRNDLSTAGRLRFLIFEHPSESLIYASDPIADPMDTEPTWKTSSLPVAIKLLAGSQYDIGAIADVGTTWPVDTVANVEPTIASLSSNPNFTDFASPISGGHACCDTGVRLLPEPGSGLSLFLGATLLAGLARRRALGRR